jgi:DDE domain
VLEKITIDSSEANAATIKSYNEEHCTNIMLCQVKYLNTIVEQDCRGVQRVTCPMLGFKSFDAAQSTLVGIELIHMLRKRQMNDRGLDMASPRPNSSTPWPRHLPPGREHSTHSVYTQKFAIKPDQVPRFLCR